MSVPFQRTVVLNVSEILSNVNRVDIAKFICDKFSGHFPVESVQFVPGGLVHVSFQTSAGKRFVESVDFVALGDVQCPVVKSGPQFVNVFVFHYPFEASVVDLRRVLSSYGEVHEITFQRYPDLNSVSTGSRIVKMVRKAAIPRSLDIGGTFVKTWYRGQPVECDICRKCGHVSKDCPLRGKCRRCLEPGHLSRDCQNPARVWKSVPPVSSSVLSGPTPAEAARALRSPLVMGIGVHGADDNWGLGSESGSAVGEDESVEGEVAPVASAAVGMEVSVEVEAAVVEVVDEGDIAVEADVDGGGSGFVDEDDGDGSGDVEVGSFSGGEGVGDDGDVDVVSVIDGDVGECAVLGDGVPVVVAGCCCFMG